MAAKITNLAHLALLTHLSNFGVPPAKPRTDSLAKSLGWTNQQMPHIGLELRAFGWVASTNDGKAYNFWQITPAGRARLLEHKAACRNELQAVRAEPKVTVPAKATKPFAGFRVIDTKDGDLSPLFQSKDQATEWARRWAKDQPGVAMQVLGVLETITAKVVVEEV